MPPTTCSDAVALYGRDYCLLVVSENCEGQIDSVDRRINSCGAGRCDSLRVEFGMDLTLSSHSPCDQSNGRFDGKFRVRELITAYAGPLSKHRGVHRGRFTWHTKTGSTIRGDITGLTNVGTARRPASNCGEHCDNPGTMEGQLQGRLHHAHTPTLDNAEVVGTYRFRFDPTRSELTTIRGVIEGMVLIPCVGESRRRRHIDLASLPEGRGPNPWRLDDDVVIRVTDHAGAAHTHTEIQADDGFVGLRLTAKTTVVLPGPCSRVAVRVVTMVSPVQLEAYAGTQFVGSDTSGFTPDELVIEGGGIDRLTLRVPPREALCLALSFELE
ncbi:MAG: hypothetical protein K0V04_41370 [Deltaproteobacteria bacterium]|nr:hypothetical protein [Deltaproteobacteria bacterium]